MQCLQAQVIAKCVELRSDIGRLEALLDDTQEAVLGAKFDARASLHKPSPSNRQAQQPFTAAHTTRFEPQQDSNRQQPECDSGNVRRTEYRKTPYARTINEHAAPAAAGARIGHCGKQYCTAKSYSRNHITPGRTGSNPNGATQMARINLQVACTYAEMFLCSMTSCAPLYAAYAHLIYVSVCLFLQAKHTVSRPHMPW